MGKLIASNRNVLFKKLYLVDLSFIFSSVPYEELTLLKWSIINVSFG